MSDSANFYGSWKTEDLTVKSSPMTIEQAKLTIKSEFSLGQTVRIAAIDRKGIVRAIQLDTMGLQYFVHYWDNASREQTWCFGSELEAK